MNISAILNQLIQQQDLSADQMSQVMSAIIDGQLSTIQIGALLVALQIKGVSKQEITTARDILWQHALKIPHNLPNIIDIVGTGGDGLNTFNVSTTSAFVVAGAGGCVAKHGSRAASSQSGSADVLRQAGFNIELSAEQVSDCLQQHHVSFIFAPVFHPAWKHALPVRRDLKIPTLFNLLGPLLNPTSPDAILLGVYQSRWCQPTIEALADMGMKHAMVVHGRDGVDEVSLQTNTQIVEYHQGKLSAYEFNPESVGIKKQNMASIQVDSPKQSLQLLLSVLHNEPGPARDMILLNAGMACYVADLAPDIEQGVALAEQSITSGNALKKFEMVKQYG